MAKVDAWMPIYWGDYAKDTGHLSAAHHGAYLMLIKHYWTQGAPLPTDDAQLWRIACADSMTHWRKIKDVVLAFFEERDGRLHHKRIEEELEKAEGNADRRAESARKAAEARWEQERARGNAPRNAGRNAPRMPDAMRGECAPPSPSPKEVTTTESVRENAHTRALKIGEDWIPKPETVAELQRQRPDLVGEAYEAELTEFRLWCRANAVTSHDPEASFIRFMRKAKGKNREASETFDQRRIREGRAALAAVRIP